MRPSGVCMSPGLRLGGQAPDQAPVRTRPPDSTLVTTGAWSGACPPSLKPGDMQTPDGRITSLTAP